MVSTFTERQTKDVKKDYTWLRAAIEKQNTPIMGPRGYPVAERVTQGKNEHPHYCYEKIFQAYLVNRNKPFMEEEENIKYLFT